MKLPIEHDSAACCEVPQPPEPSVMAAANTAAPDRALLGLFDTTGFPARWYCGTWSEALGWTHIISDILVWGAYMAIPLVLGYFTLKRRDVPFSKVFWLFCMFIFACGSTHLVEAIIFWHPVYRFSGVLKAVTAVVSWATVFALVPTVPRALALPGLEKVNAELAREIDERRRAQDALSDSLGELQARNEQLAAFTHSVSHDLKSPIVTMRNLLGVIRKDQAAGRIDRVPMLVDQLDDTALRMGDTIGDLLEFSRIGHLPGEKVATSLATIVQEVLMRQRDRIASQRVNVTVAGDLPEVLAFPGRVLCAVENLVDNAIKYACDDPGSALEVGWVAAPGEVRLFVRDSGPGIEPRFHERVFQLFERLDTRRRGTGVGLAMVRKVMEVHGGRAWVESAAGAGATFWLAFPEA